MYYSKSNLIFLNFKQCVVLIQTHNIYILYINRYFSNEINTDELLTGTLNNKLH